MIRIAFFGHSKIQMTKRHEDVLLSFLEEFVGEEKAEFFLGGKGDFDGFALRCCHLYKERYSNVRLVFITPYLLENNQKYLECRYDEIVYPNIENKPKRWAIDYRNRWMLENADFVVFGVERTWGGAYKIYTRALKKKKRFLNLLTLGNE